MPKVYIIPDPSPNAFATGRNPSHAAVAATEGLLQIMDEEELEGVIAHELSHVRNRDILISSVAATIAGALTVLMNLARWGAVMGGAGTTGRAAPTPSSSSSSPCLVRSRRCCCRWRSRVPVSIRADASGAELSHNPLGLARAGATPACLGTHAHGRQSGHRPSVYRESPPRRRPDVPLQHPPAHRRKNRPP